tara:strand:+ start:1202 stop:1336 length:135 start_codon:yes stop_codon:yes gene_type:complete
LNKKERLPSNKGRQGEDMIDILILGTTVLVVATVIEVVIGIRKK